MAEVTWTLTAPTWNGMVDGQAVCSIKGKDIGGWTVTWVGARLWPAPAHLPRALPQPTRFFTDLDEAKRAVEQELAK